MRLPVVARQAFRSLPPAVRSAMANAGGVHAIWEDGFDFTPPTPRQGEEVGPPDFVGVGVQKAGTTWWYALIARHPQVTERDEIPKELHYLCRFCTEPMTAAEIGRYHGWFPRRPGTLAGEWTPDYFSYPWVAPNLAAAAPEAKVLVVLRDPVERFRSGLTFRRSMGAPNTATTMADAVRQGYYARDLERLRQFVANDRLLVLQYEQCRNDPASQLARTYEFLGLDPFVPDDLHREVNASSGEKVAMDADARRRLAGLYAEDIARLATMLPSLDLSLWPSVSEALR